MATTQKTLVDPGPPATAYLNRLSQRMRKETGVFQGRASLVTGFVRGIVAADPDFKGCSHFTQIAQRVEKLLRGGVEKEKEGRQA